MNPHEKLIFLHIPKTAGSSLRVLVEQEYPDGACVYVYCNSSEFYETNRDRNGLWGSRSLWEKQAPFGKPETDLPSFNTLL